jgi:hypothetical protein
MWTGLMVFILGLWLMAAPAVLGYGNPAADNDRIFGPVAASLAFISLWPIARGLRWCNVPIGAWLAAAPWVLGYPMDAAYNSLLTGLAIAALSLAPSRANRRFGGGWSSLWRPSELSEHGG